MANERVIDIFEGLLKTKELIAEKNFTHAEYREFCLWFDRLGQSRETPLFGDVFYETHVLRGMYGDLTISKMDQY
ncbi:hypothetical protein [Peribacillus sp. FSL E2-0159]|uniref:hypothetical protein n=1 Tax=Peribacillus sp. FSL E2-0159 TaxID=2975289 RepID=UPI00315AFE1F